MRTGRYINLLLIPFVALRRSFCVVFLDVELLTFCRFSTQDVTYSLAL